MGIVEKYINIPFVRHQHEPHGFDCYGLIRVWYKQEYGIELPYHPLAVETQIWDPVQYEEVKQGDAFTMGVLGISHVGLVIDKDTFLHTTSARGHSFLVPAKEIMSNNKFLGFIRLKPDYKPILT